MCGKICYPDQLTANNSIRGIRRDKRPHRSKKKPVQSYYCSSCHAWHLSSKVKHRMKVIIHTIKNLNTTDPFIRGRLMIKSFTHSVFSSNDNMARFIGLLYTAVISICTVSAFGYDSGVDKVYSVSGVELVSVDYGYSYGDIATLDVEVPAEFVINAPSLGHALSLEILLDAKAKEVLLADARGPPDSCSQKSAYC